jgi:hypothetical protein
MDRRYDLLFEVGFRDITGYNAAFDRGELTAEPGTPDAELREQIAPAPAVLAVGHTHVPLVRTITVTDRDALPLVMATVYPVPRDFSLADREWHRVHAGPEAPPVHVSRVYLGRLDPGVFYTVGRRRARRC